MQKLEYKVIKLQYNVIQGLGMVQTELVLLGKEGWELVAIAPQSSGNLHAILKRPIE